jgi:hypothetical protein
MRTKFTLLTVPLPTLARTTRGSQAGQETREADNDWRHLS